MSKKDLDLFNQLIGADYYEQGRILKRSFHERLVSGEFNEDARKVAERMEEAAPPSKTGDKVSFRLFSRPEVEK